MSSQSHALIDVYDLKKSYSTPAGELSILKGAGFTLEHGDFSFILGRSGSGKSTFLNILGGLDTPTEGSILFEGEEMARMSEKKLAALRCRRIGFVFQFYHLIPELTLYENVLLPSMMAGKRDDKWARECLKRVRLYSRSDHYPSELSGGEKQRGAIARALMNKPSVVLCDEPTGNLDEETAGSVIQLLHDINKVEGQSFLIVTHDEAWAWQHRNVHRLVDGLLVPEERGPVNIEQIP